VPRYLLPSVSSILPAYANSEQDFIRRAFTNANYDMLCSLPDAIRTNEVTRRRTELIHATLSKHIVNDRGPDGTGSKKATNNHGLFQEFKYQQDPYDNMDELFREEQAASMALRAKFGGKFLSACNVSKAKHEELGDERRTLTYLCDPYEAAQNLQQRVKWMEESKILYGPFNPSGKAFNNVPQGAPTLSAEKETLDIIRMIFSDDWPGAEIDIFVSSDTKEWVVKAKIDDVESIDGFTAYMNVLLRCNDMITSLHLSRVIEQWAQIPMEPDGYIYYKIRPPWLKCTAVSSFYALHPEASTFSG